MSLVFAGNLAKENVLVVKCFNREWDMSGVVNIGCEPDFDIAIDMRKCCGNMFIAMYQ